MVTRRAQLGPAFGVPDDFPGSRNGRAASNKTRAGEVRLKARGGKRAAARLESAPCGMAWKRGAQCGCKRAARLASVQRGSQARGGRRTSPRPRGSKSSLPF